MGFDWVPVPVFALAIPMSELLISIIGGVAGALATYILAFIIIPIGKFRPFSIKSVTVTETGVDLTLEVAVRNRRFRVKQQLKSLIPLELPAKRRSRRIRHPFRWIRLLPPAPAPFKLIGDDMAAIRDGKCTLDPRTTITVKATIRGLDDSVLTEFRPERNQFFVVYPPTEVPSKRRPKVEKLGTPGASSNTTQTQPAPLTDGKAN